MLRDFGKLPEYLRGKKGLHRRWHPQGHMCTLRGDCSSPDPKPGPDLGPHPDPNDQTWS